MMLVINIPSSNYDFDRSVFNYLTTSIINYLCKKRKKISISLKTNIQLNDFNTTDSEDYTPACEIRDLTPLNNGHNSPIFDESYIKYFRKSIQHKLDDEFISSFLKRFYEGLLYIYNTYPEIDLNKKKLKKLLGEKTGLTQDRLNLYLKKYYKSLSEYATKLKEHNDVGRHFK